MRCPRKAGADALTSLPPAFFPGADSQLLLSCDSNINKQTKAPGRGLSALRGGGGGGGPGSSPGQGRALPACGLRASHTEWGSIHHEPRT